MLKSQLKTKTGSELQTLTKNHKQSSCGEL